MTPPTTNANKDGEPCQEAVEAARKWFAYGFCGTNELNVIDGPNAKKFIDLVSEACRAYAARENEALVKELEIRTRQRDYWQEERQKLIRAETIRFAASAPPKGPTP